MAITGAHMLLYTSEPEALRATLGDVFGWSHVDAGDGWLIFAMPPAEIGVHPAEGPTWESGVRHQDSARCLTRCRPRSIARCPARPATANLSIRATSICEGSA